MSYAYETPSYTWILNYFHWVVSPLWGGSKYGLKFFRAAAKFVYLLSIKPFVQLFQIFFYSPATILLRNLTNLALLPTNVPLFLFYNTTISDITKMNLHLTYITLTLCIQYLITMMFIGVIFGIWFGLILGVLHRLIRIPDKKVDLFGSLTQRVLRLVTREEEQIKATPAPWNYTQEYSASTNASPATRLNQSQRKVSRASRGSASNLASKLPHDFFQMKAPRTPLRSGDSRFDSSRLSQLDNELDDETASMSSNIWDTTEELPETLRTEPTARGTTFRRFSYASGLEQPNYTHLKPLNH
ncbi:LAFA_0G14488g1_1 [Lachancea sp. 'fantastica']|nr:LAFA_0G14488g1_1 [Lachancea sp. 'fantastica']